MISRWVPMVSVSILISSLFLVVFLQMEVRRLGYVVWKKSRDLKVRTDENRLLGAEYAKTLRPSRLQEVAARRLTLVEPRAGQIIHMSGEGVALKQ
jgi:hypothetical protein